MKIDHMRSKIDSWRNPGSGDIVKLWIPSRVEELPKRRYPGIETAGAQGIVCVEGREKGWARDKTIANPAMINFNSL